MPTPDQQLDSDHNQSSGLGPSVTGGKPTESKSASVWFFIIMGCLLLVTLIGLLMARYSTRQIRIPTIARTDFDAGWKKWQDKAPLDYRIRTVVAGRQAAEYEVTVREGRVVSATRNGQPLTQPRTMGTWSVPGMFDTIELDVNTTEEPNPRLKLTLRGEFDEQWGYPRRYLRNDYTSKTETQWEVTQFEPMGTTMLPSSERGFQMMPQR